ncbi:nitrous oxide-stimulated promoter family protein [Ferrimonas balearica]|uniref:nitrous oxide-stimulated promoter family protein n=1 Tax=Ferrimonas balearica TaxID=44012 RepID=UPI001C998833|nr:nitrous oxide-stimulated promoter family protein [Ferrimonas balearica]MBY5922698.1 nitrous oxide-stimulated promoter family protein [Ferrimonas balearica]MBY5995682.1 nitrous oxide-stimulated promoter family protein [Ferrimonas balearica]
MKSDRLEGRLAQEYRTIAHMMQIYCKDHCGQVPRENGLCGCCHELLAYAEQKLDRCPYGDTKPTCAKCPIHCYKPEPKERVRQVMRYAGPRMLLRHPIEAIRHLLDERRPVPEKPPMRANRRRNRPTDGS